MVTIGQSQLILSTSFTARDSEEVSISEVPGLKNMTVRVIFDPSVPEGSTGPLINWAGGEGRTKWSIEEKNSVIITCRGWTGHATSARGQLATLDLTPEETKSNPEESSPVKVPLRKKALTFSLFDSRLKEFHHVIFELYTRDVTPDE